MAFAERIPGHYVGTRHLNDVIIILPGISGSVLKKGSETVWGPSLGGAWNLLTGTDDLILRSDDVTADDIGDGIRATEIMPDIHLIPGLWKIDGYSELRKCIAHTFQVVPGNVEDKKPGNYFEFPYDWRRDNRYSARRLRSLANDALRSWRNFTGNAESRLILVAHSMGGLIARYYLEVLGGWRDCKALISFGTPYRGSVSSLDSLCNGYKKTVIDLTDAVRSFTSTYQLLPIYQMIQTDAGLVRVAEAGSVPHVDRDRAAAALTFHREIESAVTENRKHADYLTSGYQILPFVGTRQETLQSAILEFGSIRCSTELPAGMNEFLAGGDGTVPRASAIPIELSDDYRDSFVPAKHATLQRVSSILDDLAGRLEQLQVVGLKEVRGFRPIPLHEHDPAIALKVDDVYSTDKAIEIRAELFNASARTAAPIATVSTNGETLVAKAVPFVKTGDEWVFQLNPLPSGAYRIEVSVPNSNRDHIQPVQDVFAVAEMVDGSRA